MGNKGDLSKHSRLKFGHLLGISLGFMKNTRGLTLRSFRSWLRSTTASLVAAAVSPAVGAARRLADSMAGAAEKDCFECRVIGTSVCIGASRTREGTPSSRREMLTPSSLAFFPHPRRVRRGDVIRVVGRRASTSCSSIRDGGIRGFVLRDGSVQSAHVTAGWGASS